MTTKDDIPPEVRDFLRRYIASYDQLEVLLLVHRRSGEIWTPQTIAAELRTSAETVEDALAHLRSTNLIEAQSTPLSFQFAPRPAALGAIVDQLAQLHDLDRLGVMNLMNANAIERVRNRALHIFADAFVLGRKKNDDG